MSEQVTILKNHVKKNIRTVGDLRDFLIMALHAVNDGTMPLPRASQLSKLSAHIVRSLDAELTAQALAYERGELVKPIGELVISSHE